MICLRAGSMFVVINFDVLIWWNSRWVLHWLLTQAERLSDAIDAITMAMTMDIDVNVNEMKIVPMQICMSVHVRPWCYRTNLGTVCSHSLLLNALMHMKWDWQYPALFVLLSIRYQQRTCSEHALTIATYSTNTTWFNHFILVFVLHVQWTWYGVHTPDAHVSFF